jgi:flagellar motor switch protein FliM
LSDILSQAEIEALLSSLNSEEEGEGADEAPAEGAAAPAKAGASDQAEASATHSPSVAGAHSAIAYEVYDFRRPDKFSKEQLRTLQMLHETFARLSASGLSAYLRSTVNIDLISLEQVPYEEYLRSINQSVFTVMSLPPLSGQAVLEIEFSLIFTMIDRLLGGPGGSLDRTMLTDIEQPLVRQVIERMFTALKTAWEGVVIVNPGVEAMETSAQFVQIAPPTDIVVSILFEVRIGEARGAMSLCIPYMVLKPITTKLSAQKWFVGGNKRQVSHTARRALSNQISRSKVRCALELGKCEVSVKDFLRLRQGDVLKLNQRTKEDLQFRVSGTPKFLGQPALQDKKLVFTVTDSIQE